MGSEIPHLNSCCCGCSLRGGSLILLWIYLIAGILWMCSPTISGGYITKTTIEVTGNVSNPIIKYGYGLSSTDRLNTADVYPSFGWVAVVIGAINVAVAAYGLYGLYENKWCSLKPYLVWELIDLLIILLAFIWHTISTSFQIFPIVYICFFLYTWLVIYSHFHAMRRQCKNRSRTATAEQY